MQDELHLRGVWFLPDDTTKQINGLLDFTPNKGIDLQLLGILVDSKEPSTRDVPVICGITSDGKRVTLFKCFQYNRHFNSNGLESESYEALYLFIGLVIPTIELKFQSISVQFSDFDQWLNIYGFKKNEFLKESKETAILYQQPDDLSFTVNDETRCGFAFSTYAPMNTRISNLTVSQICEVSLSQGEEIDFFKLFNLFHSFQMFLTLSYFERPLVKKITLSKRITSEEHVTYDKEVTLMFRSDVTAETYDEKKSAREFLFTYDDIKDNFQNILSQWFEAEQSLSPTIYGLAEAFAKRATTTEFSFLNIAHAIETLHRRRRKNDVLTKSEYKAKLDDIIGSVNPEHAQWLKAKLEFANEPTLHERLQELIDELPESIKSALLKPTPEKFIQDFKRSRNYYTHYNQTLEKKALKGSDLFYLRERSKILLVCFVLKELGLSDKELERIIFSKGVWLFNHVIKYEEANKLFQSWE